MDYEKVLKQVRELYPADRSRMERYAIPRGFRGVTLPSHENSPKPVRLIQESSAIGDYEDSLALPGSSSLWVGEHLHLSRNEVVAVIEDMLRWLEEKRLPGPDEAPASLVGKVFVFTGTLRSVTRSIARELVLSVGGQVRSEVSRLCDYVVVGDRPGSKAGKAHKLGIHRLNEVDFLALLSSTAKREKFKLLSEKRCLCGRQGYFRVAPRLLVDKFGDPTGQGDGYKTSGEYHFERADGTTYALWEYKNTSTYWGSGEAPSPLKFWSGSEPHDFSVGTDGGDLPSFLKWLRSELGSGGGYCE